MYILAARARGKKPVWSGARKPLAAVVPKPRGTGQEEATGRWVAGGGARANRDLSVNGMSRVRSTTFVRWRARTASSRSHDNLFFSGVDRRRTVRTRGGWVEEGKIIIILKKTELSSPPRAAAARERVHSRSGSATFINENRANDDDDMQTAEWDLIFSVKFNFSAKTKHMICSCPSPSSDKFYNRLCR